MNHKSITTILILLPTSSHATGVANPLGGWILGSVVILFFLLTIGFHVYLLKKLSSYLYPRVPAILLMRQISIYSVIIFWALFFIHDLVQNSSITSNALVVLHIMSYIAPFVCFVAFKVKYEKEFNKSLNLTGANNAPPS